MTGPQAKGPGGGIARFGAPTGDTFELLGWSLESPSAAPGDSLNGRLIWRADNAPRIDYTVFVHLMRDGKLVAQYDARPLAGAFPTTAWRPGEVVPDYFAVAVPADLTPGPADLVVGLYDLKTLRSLPVMRGDTWSLAAIEVR